VESLAMDDERLGEDVQALRLGLVSSFSAGLDEPRSEIGPASKARRVEISLLELACLASESTVLGIFQRSSRIFSKELSTLRNIIDSLASFK
jgi:hypothetical protein